VPLCPDAVLDDGLLDLMILPELDHAARLDTFSHLLREGAAAVRAKLVTSRSSWIEYESENELNVNLDGEPTLAKQFRVECRQRVLPVHLGDSPLISSHETTV
jgi:diacylglycerol kinase family enzyme